MSKRDIEGELQSIAALRSQPLTAETAAKLRRALADRVNLIVAKAAGVAAALSARDLIPDLLSAYDRLFPDPKNNDGHKRDPQCWGKEALAKALKDLDWPESAPFVRGARYQQWEPIWGSEADSAPNLRANCLLALPCCNDILRDEKLWYMMRGLADKAAPVRIEAARALEQMGRFEAALLLRLKTGMPERDPSVTGQAFESLLVVEGERAVPFLLDSLQQRGEAEKSPELAEQAAFALSASRLPSAIEALVASIGQPIATSHEVIFRALSASRTERAFDCLLQIVRNSREDDSAAALYAFELHRDSEEIVRRIRQAVDDRASSSLTVLFERLFPAVER